MTVFAFITVFVVGLDFGIDFKGGVRMQVAARPDGQRGRCPLLVSDLGVQDPVVQSVTGAERRHALS